MTQAAGQWTAFTAIGVLYAAAVTLHALSRISLRAAAATALVATGVLAAWVLAFAPWWPLIGVFVCAAILAGVWIHADQE